MRCMKSHSSTLFCKTAMCRRTTTGLRTRSDVCDWSQELAFQQYSERRKSKRSAVFDRCHSSGKRCGYRAVSDRAVLTSGRNNSPSIHYMIFRQAHRGEPVSLILCIGGLRLRTAPHICKARIVFKCHLPTFAGLLSEL